MHNLSPGLVFPPSPLLRVGGQSVVVGGQMDSEASICPSSPRDSTTNYDFMTTLVGMVVHWPSSTNWVRWPSGNDGSSPQMWRNKRVQQPQAWVY